MAAQLRHVLTEPAQARRFVVEHLDIRSLLAREVEILAALAGAS